MTVAILCQLSTLDDLRPKDRKDVVAVLRVMAKTGRFSVFEATAYPSLAKTVDRIFSEGLVKRTGGEFPWTEIELTDAGRAALA